MIKPRNKKQLIFLSAAAIFLIISGVAILFSKTVFSDENKIKKEIEKAGYCGQKSDCEIIDSQCPFGCFVAVNKNESERIKNLIDNYQSNCVYSCLEVDGYDCVKNKCTIIFPEQPNDLKPEDDDNLNVMPGGDVSFSVPEGFGLAINQDQVLVASYIPPCSENFDYCLYYYGKDFEGTNFESAGVTVKKRNDLTAKDICMATRPEGYNGQAPQVNFRKNYSTVVFSDLGQGAAGHFTNETLYRLFYKTCYEFQTRISQSQYANFEPGAIKEFTAGNKETLEQKFTSIINSISTNDGTKVFEQ